MPRIARSNMTGKFFHIMVQGINKEHIFEKDYYKKEYKKIIKKNLEKSKIKVISYCIMNNHTHILIYSDNISSIIKFMHTINTSYGIYYNKVNDRVGYVFRDRYKTQEILNGDHLKNCIVYIHKNPVKAKIVENEEKYQYSSYNEYIENNEIIDIEFIRKIFGLENSNDFKKYILLLHRKYNTEEKFLDIELKRKLSNAECYSIIEKYRNNGQSDNEIVKYLMKNYTISERSIAENMKITRYALREIIRQK